jgi:hypothetical protein
MSGFSTSRRQIMPKPDQSLPLETTKGKVTGGYTLWQYTAGTWVLKRDASEEGYECGAPPSEPGRFEGELRKMACVRRKD